MKKNLLLHHYIKQKTAFRLYFTKTLDGLDMEDIHQLRVAVKKLRAIWSLLETITEGKLNKRLRKAIVSDLFDAAGELRETQVNLIILTKKNTNYLHEFVQYHKHNEKTEKDRLLEIMQDFNRIELEGLDVDLQKHILELNNDEIQNKSAKYVLRKIIKVHKLKSKLPDTERLHKIRIHLKAVREILSILNKLFLDSHLGKLIKNIKKLNKAIGEWHDYTVLIPMLHEFSKVRKNKKGRHHLKKYIQGFEKKQDVREEIIQEMLDDCLQPTKLKQLYKLIGESI